MQPTNPPNSTIDIDSTFLLGCESDVSPSQVALGSSWMAINMLNLGGLWSCRPGYHCLATFPDGKLQGVARFHPILGEEQILVAVAGRLYASSFPYVDFHVIEGLRFSPTAKQIFWALTTQATVRDTTDFASSISVIEPKSVLIIQDGGLTAPGWYDGSNSGHIKNNLYETPAGGPMAWVGDRLWVATDNQVFASDISNPFSFREQIYLGGVSSFFFSAEVTAMVPTPSIESPQLMVFTGINGSILQANIRNRDDWPSTPNFQEEVVQVGCLSNRSALSHYGQVVWFSPSGVSIYDPATSGKLTSRLPVRDNEMLTSKVVLSDDLTQVAAGSYRQFLLMSVPAEDTHNRHTWVLNHASLSTLSDESGPSWSGYWIGTRPVEWVSGIFAGQERIFHVSVDYDGKNRLWESFNPNRLDNGCPITWALFTRGYFGTTAQVSKPAGSTVRFQWADFTVAGVEEDLNFGVYYAGGTSGAFKPIANTLIRSTRGSMDAETEITMDSEIFAFKPQSRTIQTVDADQQSVLTNDGSAGVEREKISNIDRSFQLLVVGHGPCTLREIRAFALPDPENPAGNPKAFCPEACINAVRYDGLATKSNNFKSVVDALSDAPESFYTSSKTVVLEKNGFRAVGIGFASSILSQDAADRVATIVATKRADKDLQAMLPPVTSVGLGLEHTG
jgi:hypothetical protein